MDPETCGRAATEIELVEQLLVGFPRHLVAAYGRHGDDAWACCANWCLSRTRPCPVAR